jgi:hypothetical protein
MRYILGQAASCFVGGVLGEIIENHVGSRFGGAFISVY